MLLLESIYLGLAAFAMWFYYEAKGLGLDRDIPLEEGSRARYYGYQILTALKTTLSHCKPIRVSPREVIFQSAASPASQRIWCDDYQIFWQVGDESPTCLHNLGRGGSIEFRKKRASLLVEVMSRLEQTHPYNFTVTVPIDLNELDARA